MKNIPSSSPIHKGGRVALFLIILLSSLGFEGTQTAYAAVPSHDDFANARLIDSITYLDADVNTTEATQQTINSPNGADPDNFPCQGDFLNRGNKTVWYKYTPSVAESISVDTIGSSPLAYDTYISVWTGTANNLTLVGCNDDNFSGGSELSFTATPGTTYYIQVGEFNGYFGGTPGGNVGGTLQFHAYISNLDVYVGTTKQKSYYLYPTDVLIDAYTSVLNGPVKVISTNGDPIFTTQVVNSGSSYNELAGYPVNQFTTEYWFPYYDHGFPNVAGNNMRTWILVGNPSSTLTAEVEIRIGGVLQPIPGSTPPITTFSIPPGANVQPRWIGKVGGPVRVRSTNGVNIFASERVFTQPYNSFNEVMGYPADQFTTEYWFPWYDTKNMNTYLLVGNASTSSQTASVRIYIGTEQFGPYSIPPNTTLKQSYANKLTGPVRVVSTNGVNIVASEFTLSGTENSFNEVMGYPFNQFDTEYWFPYYDHGYPNVIGNKMRTWILVGNPSSTLTANVQIYIDGVLQSVPGSNPAVTTFSIAPGANVQPRWIGTIGGPVRVVSDIPVFTSERVFTLPTNAFNEFMGIPFSQFTAEYWFPWYDSQNMGNQLLVSNP